jgi:hypothetical protein
MLSDFPPKILYRSVDLISPMLVHLIVLYLIASIFNEEWAANYEVPHRAVFSLLLELIKQEDSELKGSKRSPNLISS